LDTYNEPVIDVLDIIVLPLIFNDDNIDVLFFNILVPDTVNDPFVD
jgi:hypothetical protein